MAIGSLGRRDAAQDTQLADLLTVRLASVDGLELVERQSFDKALQETELSFSELTRGTNSFGWGR